ncbi:MAG: hypothetical protein DUD39_00530 [Coriobacteriaceae bacterium]|nr:MAG: hypothetical protein DUD39_00530 [Coriobacteriaceae bacterium]
MVAIGVGDDDQCHFVGFTCANSKSYTSWYGFLQERWVRNVCLVTSDALGDLAARPRARQARRARQDRLRGGPDSASSTS